MVTELFWSLEKGENAKFIGLTEYFYEAAVSQPWFN